MDVLVKKLNEKALLPMYQTEGAAGCDLFACLEVSINLLPMQRCAVPTGIAIALPNSTEAQIRPRSGLAAKYGITCINTPGTIDCDYRGEIKILLINLGTEPVVIRHKMRIAQMIIAPVQKARFVLTDELSKTIRNTRGFGSTGV